MLISVKIFIDELKGSFDDISACNTTFQTTNDVKN